MTLTEAILQRRSIRRFKDQPVPEPMIRNMLDAAVRAPSASNRQPWRFMVLRDQAIRGEMAACVREAVADAAADALPQYRDEYQSYCRHFLHFEKAPVLIFALFRSEATTALMFREDTPSYGHVSAMEVNGAIISVAMAVQNMLLAAADQGLGTCVMTGPLVAAEKISSILAVPDGWAVLCMVSVGYPGESPEPVPRKTVEQVLVHPKEEVEHGA